MSLEVKNGNEHHFMSVNRKRGVIEYNWPEKDFVYKSDVCLCMAA